MTSSGEVSAVLNVQSKSRLPGDDVIQANVWLSDDTHIYSSDSYTVIYVAVLNGMSPVLKCDVSVVIEGQDSTSLLLHDNGIG